MISAAFKRILRLSAGFVLRHDLKALCADSTAAVASFAVAPQEDQTFSPVLGLKTSNVVEVLTSLPSIQSGRGAFGGLIFGDVVVVWKGRMDAELEDLSYRQIQMEEGPSFRLKASSPHRHHSLLRAQALVAYVGL
jgi:hypothetical protein